MLSRDIRFLDVGWRVIFLGINRHSTCSTWCSAAVNCSKSAPFPQPIFYIAARIGVECALLKTPVRNLRTRCDAVCRRGTCGRGIYYSNYSKLLQVCSVPALCLSGGGCRTLSVRFSKMCSVRSVPAVCEPSHTLALQYSVPKMCSVWRKSVWVGRVQNCQRTAVGLVRGVRGTITNPVF